MMKTVMTSMKAKYGSNEKRGKRQVQFEDPDADDDDNSITSSKSVGSYVVTPSYLFDKNRTMEAPLKKTESCAI
jgi:hypothetical protein